MAVLILLALMISENRILYFVYFISYLFMHLIVFPDLDIFRNQPLSFYGPWSRGCKKMEIVNFATRFGGVELTSLANSLE